MSEPRASGLAFEWARLSAAKLFPYIPNPAYYEVCTNPALYELAAAMKRKQPAALEVTRA
jgi:hypothetical protein